MQSGHCCLVFALVCSNALASPQGGVVSAGQAQIAENGNTVTITQGSNNAVVNWESFNVKATEHVKFQQPSGGITLNRINPKNGASDIAGKLSANGTVVLVNQAGILFHKSAQVNVGGIIASTADITNENFMHNKFRFNQPGYPNATVVNKGTINVKDHGLVALIGYGARNDGLINAKLGKVAFAHGEDITVDFHGDELITFGLPAKHKTTAKVEVANSGEIHAAGGQVLLTVNAAEEVLDQVINMDGLIEATSVARKNGKIVFYANSGETNVTGNIDVSGKGANETGGAVEILGKKVVVNEVAKIDLSGDSGAGTLLIGGDFQGKNERVHNAQRTYVGKDVEINADAINKGDGGKVVVWSDDHTRFFGKVSARGGKQNGDGGLIEISGKKLDYCPLAIDASAQSGEMGKLLLDPAFLIVATAGGSAYSAGVNNLFANNSSGTNTITPASIVAAAANITLQANTDVTFTNALAMTTPGATLTVQAGRSVLINASVSTSNAAINMTANDSSAVSADRAAGAGNITMTAASTLSSGTAALNLTVGSSASAPFTPGSITALGLTGGAISLTTPNALTATTIATSVSLAVDVGADSSITGIISGNGTLTKLGSGMLNLSAANTYLGATTVSVGTLRASNAAAFGNTAGGVSVTSGATIEINGVAITTEAFTLNGTGVGGLGALIGTGTCSHSGTVALGSDTTIGGTGTFTQSGIVSGAFNIIKVGTGTVIFSAANTYNGTTTINDGIFRASNATALGVVAQTVTIASGATLEISSAAIGAKPFIISGAGFGGVGALIGTGTSSHAGTINFVGDTTFGGTGTFTQSGIISGGFNLTKVGTGSISLSGVNTYSGTITVNAGTLIASNAAALGSNASNITVASGATLNINAVAVGAKPLSISGTGVGGVGALTGTGTGSYAGAITLLGDTTIGGTGNTTTLSGIISGAFDITKVGTGVIILSAANNYTNTTINAGTLRISSDGNLGAVPGAPTPGSITLGGGTLNTTAAFTLNANRGIALTTSTNSTISPNVSSLTYNGIIAGAGNLIKTGAGTLSLGGINTYTGTTTISTATLSLTTPNAIANTSGMILANTAGVTLLLNNNNQIIGSLSGGGTTGGTITLGSGTLTVNQTSDGTYAGTITGTGNLTLSSSSTNTLTLSSTTSTYSGITSINGGSLQITADTNLGTAPGVATPGKIVINGGTLIANASFTLNSNRGIAIGASNDTIQVQPGFTLIYNGIMASTGGGLTKSGTGTLSSSGVHTYTGPTVISAGTFSLNVANAIALSSGVSFADTAGATIECNGFDQSLTNLSGGGLNGGELSLGTATATIPLTADSIFAGVFSGSGNVTLNGAANKLTLTNLSGAFTGNWTLNSGTLAISADANLGAIPGAPTAGKIIFDGGILQTTQTLTVNVNRGISILASGATILADPSTILTYDGVIAGSVGGALNKSGTGVWALGGNNTYDGATNIAAGILRLNSSAALGNTTSTTVINGAELELNFNAATLANTNTLILNGSGVSSAGALSFTGAGVTINNPITVASSSTISGIGTGLVTLVGAVTGSAPLSISLANASISLPAIALTGANLSVSATGISQTSAIALSGGGAASFGGSAANTDINLNQANNFGGLAPTFIGTLGNIRDVYYRDVNSAPIAPSFTGLSNLRNLTLEFNNAAMALPAITLTNSGALSIMAGGAITQTGILTVPGTSSFNSGSNPITLGANNLLTGAVTFIITGNNDVNITNATGLIFAASTLGRNITATSAGPMSQTGVLIVPGTTNLNSGANEIFLVSNNQFTGAVSLSNSGPRNIAIRNILPLVLGTVVAGQDLVMTSGGSISQIGTITSSGVMGVAVLTPNSDINLSAANDLGPIAPVFTGTRSNIRDVNIRTINANAAVPSFTGLTSLRNLTLLFNNSAMILPEITLTNSGVLVATAGGQISQTGAITVPGTSSFTAGANPIILTQNNKFSGVVTVSNSGANDVSVTNAMDLLLAGITAQQNLNVIATGKIQQTGPFIVQGKATFNAGANQIDLTSNNAFTGIISLSNSGANDILVKNTLATVLGATVVGRNFTLESGGTITQSETITATGGTSTFSVSAPTSSILLSGDNNFGSIAPVLAGTTGNITNLNLKNINASPGTPIINTLNNLHYLELTFPNGNMTLSSLVVNGTTKLTANNITGGLSVHGLELDSNFCNLTGFVNGLSGQAAIDQIVLLNTITAGTHFFDGIDMFGSTPPTPPTPPVPVPTQVQSVVSVPTTRIAINNLLYIPNGYWDSLQDTDIEFSYYEMLNLQQGMIQEDDDCINYGGGIKVCS